MHNDLTMLLLCLLGSAWLATALAAEDLSLPPPMPADAPSGARVPQQEPVQQKPKFKGACTHCATIRSIRQVEQERQGREVPGYIGSSQYLQQRDFSKPLIGPVLSITFGKGQTTETSVGAVGSESMQRRILQITYSVTIEYDNGEFGLMELPDIGDLRVGDRVDVDGSRLERVTSNK
jgi:hypothetical protein